MDPIIIRGLLDRQYEVRKKVMGFTTGKQIKFIYYEEQVSIINYVEIRSFSQMRANKMMKTTMWMFQLMRRIRRRTKDLDTNSSNNNILSNNTTEAAEIYDNNDIFEGITDISTIRIAKLMAYASVSSH